jgi:hypothetical protein
VARRGVPAGASPGDGGGCGWGGGGGGRASAGGAGGWCVGCCPFAGLEVACEIHQQIILEKHGNTFLPAYTAAGLVTVEKALTATAEALIKPTTTVTPSPTFTPPVAPALATNTPDPASPAGAAATHIAATATVGAAYTQAAAAQLTVFPTTTALPDGGFADDYGIPGLVVMALAFVIVILFARRLRTAPETKR